MTLYEKVHGVSVKRKALHAEEQVCATRLYEAYKLTLPQFEVLAILVERGPRQLGILAGEIGVTRGNLTGVARRMERSGLVTRERSSTDERKVIASATARGHSVFTTLQTTVA